MHDEDKEKSKKVDDFKTEMKRMEALVKESKRHAKEEEKKKKGLRVECAGMRFEEWKL